MIHLEDDGVCVQPPGGRVLLRLSSAYLTHGDRQRLDNLFVRHGNNTLAVYLNDPVADADAATLGDAASHQAADLRAEERLFKQAGASGRTAAALSLWVARHTHNAVLHAETQLELEIRSLDEDGGDGRAAHDAEFDLHLILQTLDHKQQQQQPWLTRWLGVKISWNRSPSANRRTIRVPRKHSRRTRLHKDTPGFAPCCLEIPDKTRTLMMPWQVASGSPTRLVSLMDIIWSPTLSFPERAAGPLFSIPASMTVGRMEPQPDSTITTPRLSPFCFSTYTYSVKNIYR